jgi:hypothetical protein
MTEEMKEALVVAFMKHGKTKQEAQALAVLPETEAAVDALNGLSTDQLRAMAYTDTAPIMAQKN